MKRLSALLWIGTLAAACSPAAVPEQPLDIQVDNVRASPMAPPAIGDTPTQAARATTLQWMQVCWEPLRDSTRQDLAGYLVLRGPSGAIHRRDFEPVEQVARQQRCWHGKGRARTWYIRSSSEDQWAVAPIFVSGGKKQEGRHTVAARSPLRWLGRIAEGRGLQSNQVQAVAQDHSGAMWFGTRGGGLSRLDPRSDRWRTFHKADGLGSEDVLSVAQDATGALWVGTTFGLSRLNLMTGEWKTFHEQDGLGAAEVRGIIASADGSLWLHIPTGVTHFDPVTGQWHVYRDPQLSLLDSVRVVYRDKGGALWLGTERGAVSRLDPRDGQWRRYGVLGASIAALAQEQHGRLWFGSASGSLYRLDPGSEQLIAEAGPPELRGRAINTVLVERSGDLWLGTSAGAARRDARTGQWTPYLQTDDPDAVHICSLIQDRDGALWAGTAGGGASRLDPVSWRWKSHRKADSLSSDEIRAAITDHNGMLWFGTAGGGVSRFDPHRQRWHTYRTEDGLASNEVWAIAEDRNEDLWFGTRGHGVSRLNPTTGQWTTYRKTDGLADDDVQAVLADRDGNLWLGTSGGGVSRFEPDPRRWHTYTRSHGLAADDVQAIAQSADGAMWFGTHGGGVSRLDPRTGHFVSYGKAQGLGADDVQAVLQDRDGAMWVGTGGGGVSRLLPGDGKWALFKARGSGGGAGLAADNIQTIAADRSGNLWFGTVGGGVSRFELATQKWQTYRAAPQGLSSDNVLAIVGDRGGDLWFGTSGGGVSHLDAHSHDWQIYQRADLSHADDVLAMLQTREGALWFATAGGGVARFDSRSGSWKLYRKADGLGADTVRSMAEDSEGSLWFGTAGAGVRQLDSRTGRWRTYDKGTELGADTVLSILADRGGNLWFGTLGAGVVKRDRRTGHFQHYGAAEGLDADRVKSILEDKDGALWFGSVNGVHRLDPRSGRWSRYRKQSGLVDEDVRAMAQDPSGVLWFGTRAGVSKLNPRSGAWSTYRQSPDGLSGNDVRAILVDNQGALWFASFGGGVSRLDPGSGQWKSYHQAGSPGTDDVLSLMQDRDDGVWLGTFRGGVSRINLRTGAMASFRPSSFMTVPGSLLAGDGPVVPARRVSLLEANGQWFGLPESALPPLAITVDGERSDLLLAGGVVLSMWRDGDPARQRAPVGQAVTLLRQGATLWVGGHGLARQDSAGGEWHTIPLSAPAAEQPMVTALAAGPERGLWLGTVASGVCYLPAQGQVQCLHEALPEGRINALASDGKNAVWVATDEGLGWVERDGESLHGKSEQNELLRRMPITALARDEHEILWIGTRGAGLLRYDTRSHATRAAGNSSAGALESLGGGADPDPLHLIQLNGIGSASLQKPAVIDSLAVGNDGQLYVRQADHLYDLNTQPTWTLTRLAVLTLLIGGLLVAILVTVLLGRYRLHPVIVAYGRDPRSIEQVPLSALPAALRVIKRVFKDFASSTVGLAPLAALEALAQAWNGPPEGVLRAAARVLGLKVSGQRGSQLDVELPDELGLALPTRSTALLLLPDAAAGEASAGSLLPEAATAQLPALFLQRRGELRPLPGGVVFTEADLRAIGWDRQPTRHLAGLLWQRADLRALSPYQTSGDVRDPAMFFGRDAELRELCAGRCRALLVIGPRKVGKSSLLKRAAAQLSARGHRAPYIVLRETVRTPGDLVGALARLEGQPQPQVSPQSERGQVEALGCLIRRHLAGGMLLLDEADEFLAADSARGGICSQELRALVQEGVCSLAIAGYDRLYRAALSQSETAYNLGELLFLGPLERPAAIRLATEPLNRIGVQWQQPELAAHLVDQLGARPDLIQDAGRLLLLRLQGFRAPVLSRMDLDAVLGEWKPTGEVDSLRGVLRGRIEVNLHGPAQAAVWLLAGRQSFTLKDLDACLREAEFALAPGELDEITKRLVLSGTCTRQGDEFFFAVPLVQAAVSELDVSFRLAQLKQQLYSERRARFALP